MHLSNPMPLTVYPKHNAQSGQAIWYQPDSVVHMDFVNDRAWVAGTLYTGDDVYDFLSDQRTETAWTIDKNGVLKSHSGSVLRQTKSGLWVNNTNVHNIKNSTATGASAPSTFPTGWGKSSGSGVDLAVVGSGTEAGTNIPYLDVQVSGTASGTSGPFLQFVAAITEVAAAPGDNWVASIFYKGISGNYDALTNASLELNAYNSSSSLLATGTGNRDKPKAAWNRQAIRQTSPASTAYIVPRLRFTLVTSTVYDCVVRVALPLLGKFNNLSGAGTNGGATANLWEGPAPALSSGTAVGTITRDRVQLIGDALTAVDAETGTWILKFNTPINSLETSKAFLDFGGADSERRFVEGVLATGNFNFRVTGTPYGASNKQLSGVYTPGENVALGWAFSGASNIIAAHANSTGYHSDATGTMRQQNAARTTSYIANSGGLVSINSFVQELLYFDKQLDAARLQQLVHASTW